MVKCVHEGSGHSCLEEKPDKEPNNEESQDEEKKQPLAVIPYVNGKGEWIRKA